MNKSSKVIVAMIFVLVALSCLLGVKGYVYADYVKLGEETSEVIFKKETDPSFAVLMDRDAVVEKVGEYDSEHYRVKLFDSSEIFYVKKEGTKLVANVDAKKKILIKKKTKLRKSIDSELDIDPDKQYVMYRIGHQKGSENNVCVFYVENGEKHIGFVDKDDIQEGEKEVIKKPIPVKTLGLKILVILLIAIPAALFVVFLVVPSKKYYVRQTPVQVDGTVEADKSDKKENSAG